MSPLHQVVDAYRRHERSVHRFCRRHLGDADAADDATQETFARAAIMLRSRQPEVLSSYLHGIARNVCRDELRRRARMAGAVESERRLLAVVDPEDVAVAAALANHVWRKLSLRDRALFIHRLAGYSYDEIAQRLRISSVKAVEVGLTRARRRARRLLEELSAVVAGAARWWRRRVADGRRPVRLLRGARRWASWKLLVGALAAVPALSAAPMPWRTVGVSPGGAEGVALPAGWAGAVPDAGIDPLVGVSISDLALSPDYARDRTVYASGRRVDCASACSVLERSGDGGRSWWPLPARGFEGVRLLPATAGPNHQLILAAGPGGLQRSDDGGQSFRTVVAVAGPATLTPPSHPGDPLVAIAAPRIVLYHTGRGTVSSGPTLPQGVQATAISFTGDGIHLLVAAIELHPPAAEQATLLRCGLTGGCQRVLVDRGASLFRLLPLPAPSGGAIGVFSSNHLYVAAADGGTVRSVHAFARGELVELMAMPTGPAGLRLVAALHRAGVDRDGVTASTDGGRGFTATGGFIPAGAAVTEVTPDGRILVAVTGADAARAAGLRCSLDGGLTWGERC